VRVADAGSSAASLVASGRAFDLVIADPPYDATFSVRLGRPLQRSPRKGFSSSPVASRRRVLHRGVLHARGKAVYDWCEASPSVRRWLNCMSVMLIMRRRRSRW
jgi:hypothetical protein